MKTYEQTVEEVFRRMAAYERRGREKAGSCAAPRRLAAACACCSCSRRVCPAL